MPKNDSYQVKEIKNWPQQTLTTIKVQYYLRCLFSRIELRNLFVVRWGIILQRLRFLTCYKTHCKLCLKSLCSVLSYSFFVTVIPF